MSSSTITTVILSTTMIITAVLILQHSLSSDTAFMQQLYKLTVIDHSRLLVVCLFNHLFGSANTNTSVTGLGLDSCQV